MSETAQRPAITAIVPTRDRPQMLERCLATVRSALGSGDELLVVDSASADADAIVKVATGAGASVVRCDRKGETVARNAGWRMASHELVAYADDDVWVDAGWADAFARILAAQPELAF